MTKSTAKEAIMVKFSPTSQDLINLEKRWHEIFKRVGNGTLDPRGAYDALQPIVEGKFPLVSEPFGSYVKSNIKYGNKEATDKEIAKVANIAQAEDFIKNLDKKYNSDIAQGGANVSGGQKQRISIARALAVKPKIYIFDDSFSALDLKTDASLRNALSKETKNRTVLIVGQRISTISDADKIIVLDEGRIVGQGKHDELIRNNKVYREIASSQLSDNELKSIEVNQNEAVLGVVK